MITRRIGPFGFISIVPPRIVQAEPRPSLHLPQLLQHDLAVLGPMGRDRVVAHEAGTILDDQHAVAELDRLGLLATLDQQGLGSNTLKSLLTLGTGSSVSTRYRAWSPA